MHACACLVVQLCISIIGICKCSPENWLEMHQFALACCLLVPCMYARNTQPASSDNAPDWKNYQKDVDDLLAENLVSAERVARIQEKAQKAGITELPSKSLRKPGGRNHARDHKRRKLKQTKWPDHYHFEARVWNAKKDEEEAQWICITLIHELSALIFLLGLKDVILSTWKMDRVGKEHLEWMKDS